jgi:hypothetical protein
MHAHMYVHPKCTRHAIHTITNPGRTCRPCCRNATNNIVDEALLAISRFTFIYFAFSSSLRVNSNNALPEFRFYAEVIFVHYNLRVFRIQIQHSFVLCAFDNEISITSVYKRPWPQAAYLLNLRKYLRRTEQRQYVYTVHC